MGNSGAGWIGILLLLFALISPIMTMSLWGMTEQSGTPLDMMLSVDPHKLEEDYQANLNEYDQITATSMSIFYLTSFVAPLIGLGAVLLNKRKLYYLAGGLSLIFAISMYVVISSYKSSMGLAGTILQPGLAIYLAFAAGIALLYEASV